MYRLVRLLVPLAVLSTWIVVPAFGEDPGLTCEAVSVRRQDLPDGFPMQVFEEGFAILEIHITNPTDRDLRIEPDRIEVFSPKGKELAQVQATDMAPKLVKYYVRGGGGSGTVHGEARSGYPYPADPNRARYESVRRIGIPSGGAGRVDAGTGPALRAELEAHQLKSMLLEAGAEVTGYLYVESKKSGHALSGGYVVVDGRRVGF